MRARISKWGNSLAVRLPKAAADSLRVKEGEDVELAIAGDALTIRPARPRYRLEDLVAAITPENRPEPVEFPPTGEEQL